MSPLEAARERSRKVISSKLPVVPVEDVIGSRVRYWDPEVTRPQLDLIQHGLVLASEPHHTATSVARAWMAINHMSNYDVCPRLRPLLLAHLPLPPSWGSDANAIMLPSLWDVHLKGRSCSGPAQDCQPSGGR
eukprot:2004720-Pyramimonas_sp.AAC.1